MDLQGRVWDIGLRVNAWGLRVFAGWGLVFGKVGIFKVGVRWDMSGSPGREQESSSQHICCKTINKGKSQEPFDFLPALFSLQAQEIKSRDSPVGLAMHREYGQAEPRINWTMTWTSAAI